MSEAALRGVSNPRTGALRLASDARLMRIAVRGERRAFAAIFQRYHQELYRYCRAILGDEEEASDALQNTMLKVMRALPGESREIALRPWLYRIAHNEAVALVRQRPSPTQPGDAAETALPTAPLSQPEQRIETRERLRQLVKDLQSLPERQRSALVMRELNEVDYRAIGAVFETSAEAARQTVYEARVALQEMAEGREMSCVEIRKALSDGDGRVLRGRKLRSHLRGCEGCRDFRAGIRGRRADLALIAPPLPAVAAAGLLQSILGSSHTGGGIGGLLGSIGGTGKVLAGSTALKSAAAVAATATIAVGAADLTGVIHPPLIGESSNSPTMSKSSRSSNQPTSGDSSATAGAASSTARNAIAKHGQGGRASSNWHRNANAGLGKGHARRPAHGQAASHPGGGPSGARGHSVLGQSHAPNFLPPPAKPHAPAAGAQSNASHSAHSSSESKSSVSTSDVLPTSANPTGTNPHAP